MWIWMIRKVYTIPFSSSSHMWDTWGLAERALADTGLKYSGSCWPRQRVSLEQEAAGWRPRTNHKVYTPRRFPLMSEKQLGFKGLLCCLLSFMSARTGKTKGSKKQFGFCLSLNHELWCVCMVAWSEMAMLVWSCCLWHRPWKGAVKKE